MKVSVAQIDPVDLAPLANVRRAHELLARSARAGVEILVLPETWTTGYDLVGATALADENEAVIPRLCAMAKRHGVGVIGSMVLPDVTGGVTNEAIFVGPEGAVLLRYRKSHLIDAYGEKEHFKPGRDAPTVQFRNTRLAIAICYDLRFPELFRRYVEAGAEVLVVVSEWPDERAEHFELLLRARAVENQAFVVASSRVGRDARTRYAGRSQVVDPWGRVLARASRDGEEVLDVDLDLEFCRRLRQDFPVLGDRWIGVERTQHEIARR